MKVIAVSGYKPHELGIFKNNHVGVKYIQTAIKQKLLQLIEEGLEWVLISGQLGVELWAAEMVFELQEEYPDLKLAVLTPFLNQEDRWSEEKQEFYQLILSQADFVDSITKRPYDNPSQLKLKNKFIVEKSDGLLILYDDETPGSPQYILQTAMQKQAKSNYMIHTINAFDIQTIVEDEQQADPNYWAQ